MLTLTTERYNAFARLKVENFVRIPLKAIFVLEIRCVSCYPM